MRIPVELWPLVVLSAGLPALFLAGLASFAWALPGAVFGAALLRRREVRLARGGGLLVALVVWIGLSGLQVSGTPALVLFGYRWSLFLSLAMTFLWLCATPRSVVSDEAVIRVVGWTWPVLMAFGALALLLPDVAVSSPFLRALPSGLGNHPLAIDLATIRFSELQQFLGYPVSRPSAPFAYANTWGSAAGITLPFFVLDRIVGQTGARQRTGLLILALSTVPVVMSLNRGLWLSCGVAVAYVALRRAASGDARSVARLVALSAVVVGAVLMSPLGDVIDDRFERSGASNESRASVAVEAVESGLESPLLGYGAPSSRLEEGQVSVGSHGLLWYLIYSHGFVAAGLFVAWLAGSARRGLLLASDRGMWMTAVLLIGGVQMFVYDMLPLAVLLGVAAGLVWRCRAAGDGGAVVEP